MEEKRVPQEAKSDTRFAEHLEKATSIVHSWPAWKQQVLGTVDHAQKDEQGKLTGGGENAPSAAS